VNAFQGQLAVDGVDLVARVLEALAQQGAHVLLVMSDENPAVASRLIHGFIPHALP
jgi:hypothetical protein